MAEIGATTNPYKEVFDVIVDTSREVARLEPHEAYRIYDDILVEQGLDPVIYFSMAYTSGGAARDTSLEFRDIIAQNTRYADLARAAFLGTHTQFTARDIIVPSDLGKVQGWSQADFLLFWSHVIVGLEPKDATRIDADMATALTYPAFHDKSHDALAKWEGYLQFGQDYIRSLTEAPLLSRFGPNNMQSVITILDKRETLGGRTEEYVAIQLGIKAEQLLFSQLSLANYSDFSNTTQYFAEIGASSMGQQTSSMEAAVVYMQQPQYNPNFARQLGFRKTGLMNAIFTAEYYARHPGARPPRHMGHRPIGSQ